MSKKRTHTPRPPAASSASTGRPLPAARHAAAPPVPMVDQTALRFNQACIIGCLILAFLLDQPWLVAAVALVMLVGTLWPQAGLFKLVYARLLRPANLLRPVLEPDAPQPHLFAQGLGAIMLIAASTALFAGASTLGWVLAGIVVVLAAANLFLHFCLGCFIYFQLARRGLRLDLPLWRQA